METFRIIVATITNDELFEIELKARAIRNRSN